MRFSYFMTKLSLLSIFFFLSLSLLEKGAVSGIINEKLMGVYSEEMTLKAAVQKLVKVGAVAYPFQASFLDEEQKELGCYVAAAHYTISGSKFLGYLQNVMIEKAFKKTKPKLVIIEVIQPDCLRLPQSFMRNGSPYFLGEHYFTWYLVDRYNKNKSQEDKIELLSGEPIYKDQLDAIRLALCEDSSLKSNQENREKYALTILMIAHRLHQTYADEIQDGPQYEMEDILSAAFGPKEESGINYDGYTREDYYQHTKEFFGLVPTDSFSYNRDQCDSRIFNIGYSAFMKCRDINIASLFVNAARETKKVMAVYGSSHYFLEEKAIKAALSVKNISYAGPFVYRWLAIDADETLSWVQKLCFHSYNFLSGFLGQMTQFYGSDFVHDSIRY